MKTKDSKLGLEDPLNSLNNINTKQWRKLTWKTLWSSSVQENLNRNPNYDTLTNDLKLNDSKTLFRAALVAVKIWDKVKNIQ